jgi:hypothetical protein
MSTSHVCTRMSGAVSTYLSVCMYVSHLSTYLSVCMYVSHLSTYLSVCMYVSHLSTYLSVCMYVSHLSTFMSTYIHRYTVAETHGCTACISRMERTQPALCNMIIIHYTCPYIAILAHLHTITHTYIYICVREPMCM